MMKNRFLIFLSFILFLQACATGKKNDRVNVTPSSPNAPEMMGPPEPYGPTQPSVINNYGPEPIQMRPIILVLGPGLARGFAYAGVLRAMNDAHLPIAAIFTTEMGSLVGALYAVSANANQFEWRFQKFKEDVFRSQNSFLSRLKNQPNEGEKFEELLKRVFGNKDLGDTKIPIRVAIQSKDTGIPMVLERGEIALAMRAALAAPGLFTPGYWPNKESGVKAISAAAIRPFLVREARRFGSGPVVVVDVLSDAEAASAQDELKEADLVLKPDVHGIEYMDFQKKTESVFRGKNVVLRNLSNLRRLVGLPESETDYRGTSP